MTVTVDAASWKRTREQARERMPGGLGESDLPSVLLGYQRELLAETASHQVVVCEKSRRIGATWAIAADAVLTAAARKGAGGQDVFYIGYNLDMTREFIDTAASWSRAFASAASEVDEFLFKDRGADGSERDIQAFRIRYASGYEIVALCSRPRSLRGRQGYVIIDEAAFHDELPELLKAALALLIWGGKVLVISTHDGAENAFAELVEECRAGKRRYRLVRTTFDDALAAGLYRRVCLVMGKEWSEAGEAKWREEIRNLYGDDAGEELDCIPKRSGGKYLSRVLLEARASAAIPIVRWAMGDEFVDAGDDARAREALELCERELRPLLDKLPTDCRSFLGEDFGRTGDLTVLWPVVLASDLARRTPFVVELRNIPFREQEFILCYLCDRLPRFSGAALDARGNGQYLAERARQIYGAERVTEVMLTENWYREHFPRLKSALEDARFDLPADADTVDDFRAIEVVRGVPRVSDAHTQGTTGQRHGDSAVAALLANFASLMLDGSSLDFLAGGARETLGAFGGVESAAGFVGL